MMRPRAVRRGMIGESAADDGDEFPAVRRHTGMTPTTHRELDRASFTASVERHRRELHVHCYRMLGSFDEAEDLTEETCLRAWKRRETYAERASLRE